MKVLLITTTLFLLTGCIVKKKSYNPYAGNGKIDPLTSIYASAFVARSKEFHNPIALQKTTIRFNKSLSGTTTLGLCYMRQGGDSGTVEINPAFWNSIYTTISMKEELIFHELGHCILDRDHLDNSTLSAEGSSILTSVMSTYFLSNQLYIANYKNYMEELFQQSYSQEFVLTSSKSSFPASYYGLASTASENIKVYKTNALSSEFNAKASNMDEMYKDISHFGCGDAEDVHTDTN